MCCASSYFFQPKINHNFYTFYLSTCIVWYIVVNSIPMKNSPITFNGEDNGYGNVDIFAVKITKDNIKMKLSRSLKSMRNNWAPENNKNLSNLANKATSITNHLIFYYPSFSFLIEFMEAHWYIEKINWLRFISTWHKIANDLNN